MGGLAARTQLIRRYLKLRIMMILPKLSGGGAEKTAAALATELSRRHKVVLVCLQETSGPAYLPGEKVRVITFTKKIRNKLLAKKKLHKLDDRELLLRFLRKLKKYYRISVSISFLEMGNTFNVNSCVGERTLVSIRNNYSAKFRDPLLYPVRRDLASADPAGPVLAPADPVRTSFAAADSKARTDFLSARQTAQKADHIAAISSFVRKDQIEHFAVDPRKISVIYNLCRPEIVRKSAAVPLAEEESSWFGPHTVITAGRLNYQKGQWHLIRAFRNVLRELPDAKLVILGKGPLEAELRDLIRACGLSENVWLAGHRTDPAVLLSKAQLFAFSSLYEGLGNILLEAMAFGLPIVSANCPGGPAEIIAPQSSISDPDAYSGAESRPGSGAGFSEEEYGILTPVCSGDLALLTDPEKRLTPCEPEEMQLADALLRILKDEQLKKHYSEMSRRRIRDFSPEVIVPQWEELLVRL